MGAIAGESGEFMTRVLFKSLPIFLVQLNVNAMVGSRHTLDSRNLLIVPNCVEFSPSLHNGRHSRVIIPL